jgi:formate-dependent nitrite reductase membrane component NrfD
MSVGSWLLAAAGPAIAGATLSDLTGRARGLGRALESAGGALGPALAAYTAVLVADTAVPVWHEARRELPFVFAASAATSAGAAATALTPLADAGPARRLAVTAALAELGVSSAMERSLGDLGDAYHSGRAARYTRTAKGLTGAGALLMATAARRRRAGALAASALLMAGSLVTRFAVFEAGVQSSRDPRQTVRSQRRAAREDE